MLIDPQDWNWYRVITALRGPDNRSSLADEVKGIFTGRLRYWVGCHVGIVRRKPEYDITEALELISKLGYILEWWSHWEFHMGSALISIQVLMPETKKEAEDLLLSLRTLDDAMWKVKDY